MYEVWIHPWCQVGRIEVVRGRESALVFEPNKRIPAVVQVVDAVSHEALPGARVMFANLLGGERTTNLFDAEERDASGTGWRILIDPGTIDITASATGYASQRRPYPISEPDQTVTIGLYKTTHLPVVVTLEADGTLYPLASDKWIKIAIDSAPPGGIATQIEFPGMGTSNATASVVIRVSVAGLYKLRIPSSICGGGEDQLVEVDVVDPDGGRVALQRRD
jgi:hypothetical protein